MLLQTLGDNRTKLQRVSQNGLCLSFPLTPGIVGANDHDMTGGSFTIEFWAYVFAFANPAPRNEFVYSNSENMQTLLLGRGSQGYSFFYRIVISNGVGQLSFYSYAGEALLNPTPIQPEAWYHLRVSFNHLTGEFKFYINNVVTSTHTVVNALFNTTAFSLGNIDSNRNSSIFYGQMDEFRWWRSVRSDFDNLSSWRQRTQNIFGVDAASMSCAYGFEDTNAPNATATYLDSSGHGLNMTDSQNSSAGAQRGSTAPLLGGSNNSNNKIQTV